MFKRDTRIDIFGDKKLIRRIINIMDRKTAAWQEI